MREPFQKSSAVVSSNAVLDRARESLLHQVPELSAALPRPRLVPFAATNLECRGSLKASRVWTRIAEHHRDRVTTELDIGEMHSTLVYLKVKMWTTSQSAISTPGYQISDRDAGAGAHEGARLRDMTVDRV